MSSEANRLPTPEELQERIAIRAYFRFVDRGFAAGDPVRDWVEAEVEVLADLVRELQTPSASGIRKRASLAPAGRKKTSPKGKSSDPRKRPAPSRKPKGRGAGRPKK